MYGQFAVGPAGVPHLANVLGLDAMGLQRGDDEAHWPAPGAANDPQNFGRPTATGGLMAGFRMSAMGWTLDPVVVSWVRRTPDPATPRLR